MTHLSASKDISAFAQLEQVSNANWNVEGTNPSPMDDASVAERLAAYYKNSGQDPSLAFDKEDLAEFGFFSEEG